MKYLGTIFTQSLTYDLNIQRRITQACRVFDTMKHVLCNRNITAKLQVQLYNATVINILLYDVKVRDKLEKNLTIVERSKSRVMQKVLMCDTRNFQNCRMSHFLCVKVHTTTVNETKWEKNKSCNNLGTLTTHEPLTINKFVIG